MGGICLTDMNLLNPKDNNTIYTIIDVGKWLGANMNLLKPQHQ
jgi:hypothetical protein